MNILYVSAHKPWPAVYGGQVDISNRLRALSELGHSVCLVLTTKTRLTGTEREAIASRVDRLHEVPRRSLIRGLFSRMPVQVAVRSALERVDLGGEHFDLVVLDNEFTAAVLRNRSYTADRIAIRVHNDEAAYQHKLAQAASNPVRALYFRMEAARFARFLPPLWCRADALWFISSDELAAFRQTRPPARQAAGRLLPAALDLRVAGKPSLGNRSVLFLGSLAVSLNQDAVRWYLDCVHPLLLPLPGYRFVVAGSTLGHDLSAFCAEVGGHPGVELQTDVVDLHPLFAGSSVFVSPMRHGAGVKLKTVEAVLRGLPLVATPVGAEGSGLVPGTHCHIEAGPAEFAAAVRNLLLHPDEAKRMRDRAAEHVLASYDHAAHLREALGCLPCAGSGLPPPRVDL